MRKRRGSVKNIKIYCLQSCPFCIKVVDYVEEKNLEVELIDVTNDVKLQKEVESLGGKYQVPMMTVDGEPMYESDDIVDWLKENM